MKKMITKDMILEHILTSSIKRNVRSNSVEKMHVDVGA